MKNPIPAHTRHLLLQRSGGLCEAIRSGVGGSPLPSRCRSRKWLSPHHKKFRGRGGDNSLKNLVMLCGDCHYAVHRHFGKWTEKYNIHFWEKEGEKEGVV